MFDSVRWNEKLHDLIVFNWKKYTLNEFRTYGFFMCWWCFLKSAMYKFMLFYKYTKQSTTVVAVAVVRVCAPFFSLLMLTMMTQYTVVNIVTLAYFVYRLLLLLLVFIPHTRITIVHNTIRMSYIMYTN